MADLCDGGPPPVHAGDKVEFNTVNFVSPVHTGVKVDCICDNVDRVVNRNKLANSSCCRFVPKPATKLTISATVKFVADLSPVSATVEFIASVYRALVLSVNSDMDDHVT